mmetsp:Transcript_25079/g.65406  ORF Transcript_25079/g.65406 Transcript_25079/m.65406 type:complete len:354 (-) Transcript_25079:78-1139(-)|eukprot:CAMPEP_0182927448 /NCGR_PEP_ID=MMETSP0105_2-20130417/13794_1 /TAXON_ID=81532 ORGANISM="Acanthoeca-like sp., Strain 10tr" /NCGR_SAMPLE_ID=MMETSP0105_2 /ASSEMBLY_ACC=CAM_ASM_000205 /LENGTH=353 /DNA_ID=CAMNT_0025065397 /DNA_START=27 /DNA_END=1088 /DNA_ORIENTATION=+
MMMLAAVLGVTVVSQLDAGSMNVIELVNSDPNLLVVATLLKSAGLTHKLSGPGPFTVLAPTNGAFDTIDVGGLLTPVNFKTLRKVLGIHVVSGSLYPSNLTQGRQFESLDGNKTLQAIVRTGADWQLDGRYLGPTPRNNPLDLTNSVKLGGGGKISPASMINASNGVVYVVGAVLVPPNTTVPRVPQPPGVFSGCTEKSCIFASTVAYKQPNGGSFFCCGQVDAAPRMPPDIFNDSVALAEYIKITQQVSSVLGRGRVVNEACGVVPSYRPNGTLEIDWFEGFEPWCKARCGCGGIFNPCKDMPDDPATHTYCSLCGPKYNGPINVQLYHNQPINCAHPPHEWQVSFGLVPEQ